MSERAPHARRTTGFTAAAVAVVCGLFFACANSESVVNLGSGVIDDDGGIGATGFVTPDASVIVAEAPQCPSSLCAAQYRTCPGSTFPCDVDVENDSDNCGSCGAACPKGQTGASSWTTKCGGGTCHLLCDTHFSDCNGKVEDGCEKQTDNDAENCGSCGFKCAAGVKCMAGKCGCPTGQLDCGGTCTDVTNNDANCGVCGKVCEPPDGGAAPPNQ